ncbi:(E)-beta-farnesene synthase [Linum perenne]
MLLSASKQGLWEKLNLVDVILRLGIGYHFEEEIQRLLQQVYDDQDGRDLWTVSLRFRLLRQHGYNVSSDAFKRFKIGDGGSFKEEIVNDFEGMLSLYEAAYMRIQGESILDEAIHFTKLHLEATKFDDSSSSSSQLAKRISHALERPLRKGVAKIEQLFFITVYEQMHGHDETLLALAKLSFNLVNMVNLYLEEARWLAKSYVPTLEEYKQVSSFSTTYQSLAFGTLCGLGELAPREVFDWLFTNPKILAASSDHCRLMDDIQSHQFERKREHVVSSVECYMTQYGVSREEAVNVLSDMVEEDWKIVNEELLNPSNRNIPKEVLSLFLGYEQVMDVLYKYSDGYTHSNTTTKDMLTALLVTALPID